jgi:hypothetical protein
MLAAVGMPVKPLLLLSLLSTAAAAPPADFRQTRWGMNEGEVRAAEGRAPGSTSQGESGTILRYDSASVAGMSAHVVYIFAGGKLVRAKYVFDKDHDELNDFIADFRAVEPLLREWHGKPTNERAIWEDDSTQLEPKSYLDQDRATPSSILPSDPLVGLAVALGHLRLFTQWEDARTKITHALTGEDSRIVHQIEYKSVEFGPLEKPARPR